MYTILSFGNMYNVYVHTYDIHFCQNVFIACTKNSFNGNHCNKLFLYRLFHKTLPRSECIYKLDSVRFYETD